MSSQTYLGIPRDRIPWFPTIDVDRCTGCGDCLEACPNGVFELDEAAGKTRVAVPTNCVVLCDKCAGLCNFEAIAFPDKVAIKQLLRRLVEAQTSSQPGHQHA